MRTNVRHHLRGWVIAAYALAAILSAFAHHPPLISPASAAPSTIDWSAYTLPGEAAPDICVTTTEPVGPASDHAPHLTVCEACLFAACQLAPPAAAGLIIPRPLLLKSRAALPVQPTARLSIDRPRARDPPILTL
jgi:hypothetical protein